jgi:catechol 2,3-dioxygenase-like lactoylglutathione lyase family enzyme
MTINGLYYPRWQEGGGVSLYTAFIFLPVSDLAQARRFYGDTLGLEVAWHMGDQVTAFRLPGTSVELLLSASPGASPPGVFLQVSDVDAFGAGHTALPPAAERYAIPGGTALEYRDPDGWTVGLVDEPENPLATLHQAMDAYFHDWVAAWDTGHLDDLMRWLAPHFEGMYLHGATFDEPGNRDAFRAGTEAAIRAVGPGRAHWRRDLRAVFVRAPGQVAVTALYEMTAGERTGRALTTEEWTEDGGTWRLAREISLYQVPA